MASAQPHDPFLPSQVSDEGCPDNNSDSQYIIGEFTATHALCMDLEEISDETLDVADIMDVDTFEEL